jgi:pseudaminic acid synthase
MKSITINNRVIGPGHPAYIIAEMSANHNRNFEKAVRIIETAKETGADAIKFQTYRPDTITMDCDNECFRVKGTHWEGRTLYNLYQEAFTPWEWQPRLKEIADKLGLDCFSTPFDLTAVEFLERMDVSAYKVASFENVDLPLLRTIASTGKPLIISTGMATLGEIEEAVNTVREAGGVGLALLKCTSAYPAPPEEMNLRTIPHLAQAFGVPAGLSDHTLGSAVPVAAVSLGACIIEKHLTLSRDDPGPDSMFSMEPHEFREMVKAVRIVEKALGKVSYEATENERASRVLRRSLFVVRDMQAGEPFTEKNIRSIRPGHGLHTRYLDDVLDGRASRALKKGTPLTWDCVQTK